MEIPSTVFESVLLSAQRFAFIACSLFAVIASPAVMAPPAAADITTEPGWPCTTGYSVSQSATAAQLDTDPQLEIAIASQDGYAYVYNHDGTLLPGWPRYMGGALWPDPWVNQCSSPAVADLNQDGTLEIIVGCFDGKMYVFEPDGSPFGSWPYQAGFMIFSTPAVGNLDDDNELEIVFGANDGKIYALNPDKSPVPGFPVTTPYVVRSSPALGDLDDDGKDEIVITADNSTFQLYALNDDGTALPGFPKYLWMSGALSSPALGDLDHNGAFDIVVGSRDGKLHVMRNNGSYLPGWPLQAGYSIESSPALANLDGDPDLEIVVGLNDSKVAAYNLDGTLLPGWPQTTAYSVIASPSIGDIDADGELEIVCPDNTGAVNAWNVDGSVVAGFPLHATYTIYSGALLEDLDRDGSLELLVGCNDTKIYCWDLGAGTYNPHLLPWPEWRRDARNRANAGSVDMSSVRGLDSTGGVLSAHASPNPFQSETRFALELAESDRAALRIFDIAGREVRSFALDGGGPRTVDWDGRDSAGRDLPSGVFFYRLETGRRPVVSGRAVIVR